MAACSKKKENCSKSLKIAITGNPRKKDIKQVLEELSRLFKDSEVFFTSNLKGFVNSDNFIEESEIGAISDIVVSLGGDGTLLRSSRFSNGKPVLGINLGGMGFLTSIAPDDIEKAVGDIKNGNYYITERFRIEAVSGSSRLEALNDITIFLKDSSRMLELTVYVDEEILSQYRADGLIISTPTGSTAYNLSAGGPIIYPTLNLFILSPICPHKLTLRPMVLAPDVTISVRARSKDEDILVSADGQVYKNIGHSGMVTVRKSDTKTRLINFPWGGSFFSLIREKLSWG